MQAINQFPKQIEDLLASELRRKIYEAIVKQEEPFTQGEILEKLRSEGIQVSLNMLQQFIQALVVRRFLITLKYRTEKKMGRSRHSYVINPEYKIS